MEPESTGRVVLRLDPSSVTVTVGFAAPDAELLIAYASLGLRRLKTGRSRGAVQDIVAWRAFGNAPRHEAGTPRRPAGSEAAPPALGCRQAGGPDAAPALARRRFQGG